MSKKAVFFLFLVVGLLVLLSGVGYADAPPLPEDHPQYVPGEVLLKLKVEAPAKQIAEINNTYQTQTVRHFDFIGVYHLRLPTNLSVTKALVVLQGHSLVEYVVPNSLHYLDVTAPNDPDGTYLWGLHNYGQNGGTPDADIDAPEAWDITTGNPGTVVAVIDSGADLGHDDLAANIWTNPGEIPDNGIDDDGNGYIDDMHGWDFTDDDNDPSPAGGVCNGHGSHTAGTIGAVGNNGIGVVGVNWNVKIMVLKAFKPFLGSCVSNSADEIAAIEYHTKMGVPVSSNSWGGRAFNSALRDAIRASHSVFAAAAGNDGQNNDTTPYYPSSFGLDNIISVAATNRNDGLASFSNYGPTSVDLAAPGVDIYSTLHLNNYGIKSGTSMATPHVAGVAALLLAQDPNLTIREIKWRILHGTDNVYLPVLTEGRLNAYEALQFGLSTPTLTVEVTPLGPTNVRGGDLVSYQVIATNNEASEIQFTGHIYARLQDGREFSLLYPTDFSLGSGNTISRTYTEQVPGNFAPGTTFRIYGQAETAVSFDEDWVAYTVVP